MLEFSPARLAPFFQSRLTNVTIGVGTKVMFLPANPNRVAWTCTFTTNAIQLFPGPQSGNLNGLNFTQQQSWLLFKFADWGGLICGEWWGLSNVGTVSMQIMESLYMPPE